MSFLSSVRQRLGRRLATYLSKPIKENIHMSTCEPECLAVTILKHIFDLARFLIQAPPVPVKMRRRLLSIGSGDPTRAICSSLVAKAFQSVDYPILPDIEIKDDSNLAHLNFKKECYHIRHHSLFAPRDFDISPYFKIIKPTLEQGFDPHKFNWAHQLTDSLN